MLKKVQYKNVLTAEQKREIRRILIDEFHDQFKLNFMLWTRAAIHTPQFDAIPRKLLIRICTEILSDAVLWVDFFTILIYN
ncbi:MAG: hypothetical protein FWE84_02025 [Firmicutes bacterium]|nr:hypothetical protein [Bacillota bacterium]